MNSANPDVPVVPLIKLAIIAVGCLIGGPVLMLRNHLSPVPTSVESLTRIEGAVKLDTATRQSRHASSTYPVLVIDGARYEYLDWFPQSEQLTQKLHDGEKVAIWSDVNDNHWVWQIERNGEMIVPFEAVRQAVSASRKEFPMLGVATFGLGVAAAVMFVFKTRPFWPEYEVPQPAVKKKKKKRRVRPLESFDDDE